jgi:co-chaperonin GroES (HSP10)
MSLQEELNQYGEGIDANQFEGVPEALPGRVIVIFPKPKARTEGGLYIPEFSQYEKKGQCRVVDVGFPVTEEDKIFVKQVKKGDVVLANPTYGEAMTVDGITYRIMRTFEIHGKYPLKRTAESH